MEDGGEGRWGAPGECGILQVDGYGGYKVQAEKGDAKLAFCWAHGRRRFYELAAAGPAPIAIEMLERIAPLYRIDTVIRGRPARARCLARQETTRPVLDALETFLREKLHLISQKTKLAEVIRCTLSRWEGLGRFTDDGGVEIDNNTVERSIRPLALTSKNALFAGSDAGDGHWAVIASLIETCKLNCVDPLAYITAVITLIVKSHPNRGIDDLMPWQFRPADAPAAVAWARRLRLWQKTPDKKKPPNWRLKSQLLVFSR